MKSTVPWPVPLEPLMRRDGGPPAGKSEERRMVSKVGGTEGIRRVDVVDLDGTTHILNTRNSNPIVRSKARKRQSSTEVIAVRGFVAHVPVETYAAQFSPYTLVISDPEYTLYRNTYTVIPFASPYNVPGGDTTNWHDVASFYATKILINGKEMSLLKTTGLPTGAYVPWLIPHSGSGLDKYGDAITNGYEKRVFAVGRYEVKSWFSSGISAILQPAAARTNTKALTVGQRIDALTNAAYLGQIYSAPYDRLWDDLFSEWYWASTTVDMTLSTPYLLQTDTSSACALAYAWFSAPVSSSGSMTTSTTLPATELWVVGHGHLVAGTPFYERRITFGWDGTASAPMQGEVYASYSRVTYSATASESPTVHGVVLTYTGNNTKTFDVRAEDTRVISQEVPLLPPVTNFGDDSLSADATNLFWSRSDPQSYRGRTWYNAISYSPGSSVTITGSSITRNYHDQTASFSVSTPYGALVNVTFSKHYSYGPYANITPETGFYDVFLADPYGWVGDTVGIGTDSAINLRAEVVAATDRIYVKDTYKQNPSPPPQQTPDVIAEVTAEFDRRAGMYTAQTLYQNENSDGTLSRTFYNCSVTTLSILSVSLVWSTTDYILHDVENGVFISINASFSGADTLATLTVSLKVQTRYHTATQELAVFYYSYGEMLPEKTLDSSGKTAVTSPRIRAMFAPLYQEQGSFKGAHYVTLAEEGNGAVPAHLFNFNLYLQSYDSLGTCNDSNAAYEGVYFVPCNLLEMLYAYVFSSKYGVDDYQRYPVDNTERYNTMMTTLFSTGIRVECRDGAFVDWLDTLAGEYITSTTTELTRV